MRLRFPKHQHIQKVESERCEVDEMFSVIHRWHFEEHHKALLYFFFFFLVKGKKKKN